MNLSDERLRAPFAAGESWRVEFKQSLRGGARDDGAKSDFTVDDRVFRERANIETDGRIVPLPTLSVEKRDVQGMALAIISVMPSESPPVRFNGRIGAGRTYPE